MVEAISGIRTEEIVVGARHRDIAIDIDIDIDI